eukprot:19287-Heterococcus_DN1.PRE.1
MSLREVSIELHAFDITCLQGVLLEKQYMCSCVQQELADQQPTAFKASLARTTARFSGTPSYSICR